MASRSLEVTYLRHQVPVFDCPARNVVYVKGRRAGGTLGAVNRLIEIAHTRPGTRHLWIDTVQRNIERYVRRYFLPRLDGTRCDWNAGLRTLRFEGGAYCDFGSAEKPENIEGFAYDHIWVNEAGIVLQNEELYYNTLLPMVLESPQAQLFFIGAPKGGGLFKRMYEWGKSNGRKDWRSFRHASYRNPLLNAGELKRLKRHMPERVYRQEILAEFVEDEGSVFQGAQRAARAEPEASPEPTAPYVLGVDLARYEDYTVVWVGRADTHTGVHCERFRRLPWRQQVQRIAELSRRYGGAPAFVDATGVGDVVCEALQESGLAVQPVVLSAQRKRHLIDHLALGIEQERLTFVPHDETLRELALYEHTRLPSGGERTGAPPGEHDDCVIALALCFWGMAARSGELILGSNTVSSELRDG